MKEVGFLSVVPSPYQRDIFAALARRGDVRLSVYYMEAAAPDSPWPERELPAYSQILRGGWFPIGSARCHANFPLPDFSGCDVVVLNTLMSVTAQCLMRGLALRRRPWMFWGERLSQRGGAVRNILTAPLHRAAGIAGIGSLATRQYSERFPEPLHFCIPYYCEIAAFQNTPRKQDGGKLVFLFCGQMIARKGVDHLLAAFSAVAARHPHVELLLVGREAELPQMLAAVPAGARSRIEYAGFQPPEALPGLFAQADVFVLPSRYDGWGVVVNQAIGAGLPVICSETAGAGLDLVEPEVNGLRFPPGDVPALTRCLERFANNPELASEWGAASRARAAEWTPDRGAQRWVDAISAVLAR